MIPYNHVYSYGPMIYSLSTGFLLSDFLNNNTQFVGFGFCLQGNITPSDYVASARVTLNWATLTDTNQLICDVYTSIWNATNQMYVPNTKIQTGTYVSHVNSVAGLGGNNKDVLFNLSAPAGSSAGPFFLVLSYNGVTANDLKAAYPQTGNAYSNDYVAGGQLGLNPAISVGIKKPNANYSNIYSSSLWPFSLTDNNGNVLGSQIIVSSFNGNGTFNLYQTRKLTQDFTVPARIVASGIKLPIFAQIAADAALAPVFSITQAGNTVSGSNSYITPPIINGGGSDFTYLEFTSPITLNSGLTYTLNIQSNYGSSANSLIPSYGKKQVTNDLNFPWSFSYFNGTTTTAYPNFWLPFEFIGGSNFSPPVVLPAPQQGRTTLNI